MRNTTSLTVADREAGDAASIWRFTPGSVRRALDTGRTADDISTDLAAVAVGGLPQPLAFLVHDAARGHGRTRVAPAACVIHSEEPALLAELAAHRKFAHLGLRQLAPTVLVSRVPPDKSLAALRAAGYAPVIEAADGTVRVEQAHKRRVPPPRSPGDASGHRDTKVSDQSAPATADVSALAAALRRAPVTAPEPDPGNGVPYGTDTEEILAGHARLLSLADVRQLGHAIDEGQKIIIEYVAASGSGTVRTLSELELDPPYLYAWCHLRDAERVFALSRIHGVMPA